MPVYSCRDEPLHENLGAKETRQQLFQPGRGAGSLGQKQHKIRAKTVDQSCISWISVLYIPNVLTQIKFCVDLSALKVKPWEEQMGFMRFGGL